MPEVEGRPVEDVIEEVLELADEHYEQLEETHGEEIQRAIERAVLLRTIDTLWVQHLTAIDELRQGIGLRAYGQANPLVAYKSEAHDMWDQLLENIRSAVARQLFHTRPVQQQRQRPVIPANVRESGPGDPDGEDAGGGTATATATATRRVQKVGRNAPCPCGSGKKYKRCHGQAA